MHVDLRVEALNLEGVLYPSLFFHLKVWRSNLTTLISGMATPITMLKREILEPGRPFDASFKLYGDKRLSLLEFVRPRLLEAEFAIGLPLGRAV